MGSQVMGDLWAYKVGDHQHRYEIAQALGIASLSFTPRAFAAAARLARHLHRHASSIRRRPPEQLRAALENAYGAEPFVHLLPRALAACGRRERQ